MGEILIIDKDKADELIALGFKCYERRIKNNMVYVFTQTPELMGHIGNKFDSGSFFINKNLCF